MSSPILRPRPINSDQILAPRPILAQRPILSVDEEVSHIVEKSELITDPVLFAQTFLQIEHIWETQGKILTAIKTKPRVAVKACHASSKTFSAAIATLWFLAAHEEAVVVTTAPSFPQVEKLLWGEVHAALQRSRYPFPKANQTELKMGPKRYAYGRTTAVSNNNEGVGFQGFHAANVLVIIDEAPGVDPKIYEAIEGARAGGNVRVLMLGNPTIASGPFHVAFTEGRDGWDTYTIDAFDTPNFRGISLEQLTDPKFPDEELDKNICPYLVTRRWVRERFLEWGVDHPSWQSRVRGQFPEQSEYALINLAWLELAKLRDLPSTGECEAGIDVAGPGDCETSITIRKGPKVLLHKQTTIDDPRGFVVSELTPFRDQLSSVKVDMIGIGWGMYTHLKELKYPAIPVNVCESANDTEKFADLKSEFYWGLRIRAKDGDFCGLTDEKSIGQLAGIQWKQNSRGQVEIESKDDARKRGVKSPDRAESVMLAFASKSVIYGALDYYKQVQKEAMQKAHISQLIKPQTSAQQQSCPQCSAICVVRANGQLRCGQCGHQWNDPSDRQQPRLFQNRNDILMKKRH